MTTRRVTTPEGLEWTVRRRWIPHREGIGAVSRLRAHRRKRSSPNDGNPILRGLDVLDFGVDVQTLTIVIAVVVSIFFLFLLGWPILLLGVDLAWFLVVGALGTMGRLVFRRPWRVEAVHGNERRQWYVQGFRAAGTLRDELVRQFRHGQDPMPGTLASD